MDTSTTQPAGPHIITVIISISIITEGFNVA